MTLIYLILYFLMPNLLKVLFIVLNLTCGSPHWGSKEPWGETSARYTWRHLVQSLSHWLCPLSLEGDPVFSFFKQFSIIMCCIPYCIQLIFIHYLSLRNWEARLYIKSMCHILLAQPPLFWMTAVSQCGIYDSRLDHPQPGFSLLQI